MNGTRLFEGLVIAVLTAIGSTGASYFTTVPAISTRMELLSKQVEGIEVKVNARDLAAAADKGEIIRVQSSVGELGRQLGDYQRINHERLKTLERRVFNTPG